MKNIVLCADDYGQNPAISQAIIDLIEKKRLSATSCMTNSFYWPAEAEKLKLYRNQIDIGLHINLTEGESLSGHFKFQTLPQLLIQSHRRKIKREAVVDEVNAQLDAFIAAMDQLPDFLDGHQHIHQFPIIRDAIIDVYVKRLKAHHSYIRSVYDATIFFGLGKPAQVKRIIIQLTGASALKKQLLKHQLPHNTSFSGVYDFSQGEHFKKIFPTFLNEIKEGGLIMCHPGHQMPNQPDEIYQAREYEYQYFSSDQFLKDCADYEIRLISKRHF